MEDYGFPIEIDERKKILDGYMKRAIVQFSKVCKYDLKTTSNDASREFDIDIAFEDFDELLDIVSDGMLIQWMKPYVYKQENLENVLNTRDFSGYSPGELLNKVTIAYRGAMRDFANRIKNYSYDHGDLSDLSL